MVNTLVGTIRSNQSLYVDVVAPFLDLPDIARLSASGQEPNSWIHKDGKLVVPNVGIEVPNDRPALDFIGVARRLYLPALREINLKPLSIFSTVAYLSAALQFVPLERISIYGSFDCLRDKSDELVGHFRLFFQAISLSTSMKRVHIALCHLGHIFEEHSPVQGLRCSDFSNLQTLCLWNCSLSDRSIRGLAKCLALKRNGPARWIMSCPQTQICPNQGLLSSETAAALGDAVAALQGLRVFRFLGAIFPKSPYNGFGSGMGLSLQCGRLQEIEVSSVTSETAIAIGHDMGACPKLRKLRLDSLSTVEAVLAILRGARKSRSLEVLSVCAADLRIPDENICRRAGLDLTVIIALNCNLKVLELPAMLSCSTEIVRCLVFAQIQWGRPECFQFGSRWPGLGLAMAILFCAGNRVAHFIGRPFGKKYADHAWASD